MRDNVINFILFQIGWFACVLSSAATMPWLGALIAVLIIGYHLGQAPQPQLELWLLLTAMLIGIVWDSLLVALDLLMYPAGMLAPNTAPYWIVIMWALFATTLNRSLHWLKHHYGLALLLGAIAGPLAYYGGARMGAVMFVDQTEALITLAVGWGVFTPLLVALSGKFNGYRQLAEA